MKSGAELIAEERERQVAIEGYGAEHDDEHLAGELVSAAIAYCLINTVSPVVNADRFAGSFWPWSEEDWKPKSRIEDLVRAGALIAAEIDRWQRKATSVAANEGPKILKPPGFQR